MDSYSPHVVNLNGLVYWMAGNQTSMHIGAFDHSLNHQFTYQIDADFYYDSTGPTYMSIVRS